MVEKIPVFAFSVIIIKIGIPPVSIERISHTAHFVGNAAEIFSVPKWTNMKKNYASRNESLPSGKIKGILAHSFSNEAHK